MDFSIIIMYFDDFFFITIRFVQKQLWFYIISNFNTYFLINYYFILIDSPCY